MADVVQVVKLKDAGTRVVHVLTNKSDGTGESAVLKIDASTLADYRSGGMLSISKVKYCVSGSASVELLFDGTPDKRALILSGNGEFDLSGNIASLIDNSASTPTADILLTTIGFVANSTYTIVLELTKVGFNL